MIDDVVVSGRATAIHEAAHVVTGRAYRIRFQYVTIVPSPGENGYALHWPGDPDLKSLPGRIIMCLAGGIASRKYLPSRDAGDRVDIADAEACLRKLHPTFTTKQLAERMSIYQTLAEARVTLLWSTIEKLADRLQRKGTLDADDLHRFFAQEWPDERSTACGVDVTTKMPAEQERKATSQATHGGEMTTAELEAMADAIADSIAKATEPLLKRIVQLERRLNVAEMRPKGLSFEGAWQRAATYVRHSGVVHDGSLFVAVVDQTRGDLPGSSNAWQLVAKRGRDGRDAV